MTLPNGLRQKSNRASGKLGEAIVRNELERRGFRMIEKVHTPFTVVRGAGGRVVSAFPVEKVSGDFIAIQPLTGQKVLVEVKSREAGNFPYSMLEPHQIDALNENYQFRGISLLALVRDGKTQIHTWPIHGFEKGKSLEWRTA